MLILGHVNVEASTKKLLQPTGYGVYRPGAGLHSPYFDSSLPVFGRLQRITGYSELPVTDTWYRTELPKVNLEFIPVKGITSAYGQR